MQAELFWVDGPNNARLAVMPRPRAGDWLEDEVSSLRRQGLTMLVCLLTDAEIAELALEELEQTCLQHSVKFLRLPIEDRSLPSDDRGAMAFVDELATTVQAGETVGIHCRMGLGRSAMIAAAVLVRLGLTASEAFARIAKARGHSVPDTPDQRAWVERLPRPKTAARPPAPLL